VKNADSKLDSHLELSEDKCLGPDGGTRLASLILKALPQVLQEVDLRCFSKLQHYNL
jgi:hypothetical protein